jgi:predicted ATPase
MKDIAHPEHVYQLVIRGLASDFPALKSLDARPNNLPRQLTSFVGRRPQVDAVSGLLHRRRFVTLTGPGGTGKTRLALQVAETVLSRFRDGIFFVDLSPTTDPQLIASAIAQALGIKEEPGRPPVETLEDHLRDLELLLVLDNFEQIVEAARVVEQLLRAAAGLRVVVTSRVTLHLYGEHEFEVPPLALPDPALVRELDRLSQYEAVALFIDRARSVDNDFALTTQSALTVAEICMRLDGLPLAIELAAVRVRCSPSRRSWRLERRLPLLTGGPRNVPERQRTLRGTIAWSHELLSEIERRLFARLSVFSGGATLEAVDGSAIPAGNSRPTRSTWCNH